MAGEHQLRSKVSQRLTEQIPIIADDLASRGGAAAPPRASAWSVRARTDAAAAIAPALMFAPLSYWLS